MEVEIIKEFLKKVRSLNTEDFRKPVSNGNTIDDLTLELDHFIEYNKTNGYKKSLIIEQLATISNGDFSNELPVSDAGDDLDTICMALNIFVEELRENVVNINTFKNVFNSLRSPFFIIDAEQLSLNVINPSALSFFKYSKENRYKIPIADLVDEITLDNIKYFLAQDEVMKSCNLVINIEGEQRNIVLNLSRLKSSYTDVSSISVFVIDITAQLQIEELKKEKKIIQKSLEFRTQFLANMSHEIRTPLNGIVGMIDYLVGMDNINKEVFEYLDIIKNSSDQLLSVVNDVLNLSRLEAGEFELIPTKAYLPEVIERSISWFNSRFKEKNLKVDLKIKVSYWKSLYFDEARLLQVLSNLIGNAIKFSPPEEHIEIIVSQIEEGNKSLKVKFQIIDKGIGISRINQEKLFSLFGKVEIKKNIEGAGLGLVISKQLIDLYGGEIGVVSTEGKGSEFWFTVKLSKEPGVIINTNGSEKIELQEVSTRKIKALLVDDKLVNRKVGGLILKKIDFDIDYAENGLEAYQKVLEGNYEVVFMDIQMPIMGGVEATEKIRKTMLTSRPLIIGLSANAMEGDDEYYLKKGMDYYIMKPITGEKISVLRGVIEKKIKN